jgi:hypothetical protein
MSDKVLSLIRTYVPVWTAAALVWLASVLNIVIPEEASTGAILLVVAVAQGIWYWLIRQVEPHLPKWARVLLIGTDKTPVYATPVQIATVSRSVQKHGGWPFTVPGIAQVCHEANRALQLALGEVVISPHWEEAPNWQRTSSQDGVEKALNGATAEELHESWAESKLADGWVYGPVKDDQAKTHPDLVPYQELPPEQQKKDELFRSIVDVLG